MSLHAYRESAKAEACDSFSGLIMAAYARADTENAAKLRAAWPEICAEKEARYWAPRALLVGERDTEGWSRPDEYMMATPEGNLIRSPVSQQ